MDKTCSQVSEIRYVQTTKCAMKIENQVYQNPYKHWRKHPTRSYYTPQLRTVTTHAHASLQIIRPHERPPKKMAAVHARLVTR
jgi:hypothetical protein